MGNGAPEILAMADIVTYDVAEDSLYNTFKRLGVFETETITTKD